MAAFIGKGALYLENETVGGKGVEAECLGARVNYTLTGSGEHRVVLLHGWGCSIQLMQPIAQMLEGSMRVLCVDFPGFGESGRPPEPWGVPEYAACLLELLQKEDFLPCCVIAHSFGARVAIYLAARDQSLFEKMILTGAAGIRKPQTEEGKQRQEAFRRQKEIAGKLRATKVLAPLADRMEEKAREKYGSRDYNALDPEMRKTFVKVISLDLTDNLSHIHAPTLLVWGDKDTETPLWMGQKMEQLIPDAGLAVFENGTHFAYLEQRARFGTVAQHFFA